MASENYVGRIGRLAFALGIGAAVATGLSAPAWADETGTSSSASASESSSPKTASGGSGTSAAGKGASGQKVSKRDASENASDAAKAGKKKPGKRRDRVAGAGEPTEAPDTEAAAETVRKRDAAPKADIPERRSSKRPGPPDVLRSFTVRPRRSAAADTTSSAADTEARADQKPPVAVTAVDPAPSPTVTAAVNAPAPVADERVPVLVAVGADVNTESSGSMPSPVSPMQASTVLAALAAARDELERDNSIQSVSAAAPQSSALAVDTTPNVLVIGVDGANLARILADPANVNFFEVMEGGTTAAASIAGHTTLSNPSWTAVLTGLWGETSGVVNNIYNPAIYDTWPTVFNQLETLDPAIQTTAIANWDVVAAIAASGSVPADNVLYVPQISGDANWLATDDAVGDATEAAIAAALPTTANFVFSYFVAVDENGHLYGGASPQYADAVQNVDRNLGEILAAVDTWEAATGEQWTIIVVTDHGHQPQLGFGHGFQSPDETTTFVIANNPDLFTAGGVNSAYQIVDVTPTVVTLFGGSPAAHSDGVSLTTLDGATDDFSSSAELFEALQAAIDDVDYPDPVTDFALGVRTVFVSIPYFLVDIVDGIVGELRGISAAGTLFSPLAYLAIGPAKFTGDALYVATNILAQVVARLTGVTGNSIFPLLPPDLPDLQTPGVCVAAVWNVTPACSVGVAV